MSRLTEDELNALAQEYPISDDVVRVNKGNPATAIIKMSPERLESYRRELGLPAEKEADLASWFEDFLTIHGYKWFHIRSGRVLRDGKEIYETPTSGETGIEDYFI